MAVHEFALALPEKLYRRAERAARLTHCEIKDILVSTLETTLPFLPGDLPSDLAAELTEWAMLDDEALHAIASAVLSPQQQRRFSVLLRKESEGRLSEAEAQEWEELQQEYLRVSRNKAKAHFTLDQRAKARA
ncbi:hypothetical protein IH992_00365 [Candidatus Poribacteria bacterium]|nr:hypothetical protein [Candidatus Poribacteria bacterium]